MKILIYFNSMAPAGGIERVISKHVRFLSREHEVILLTDDHQKSFYDLPSDVVHDTLHDDSQLNMNSKMIRLFQVVKSILKSSRQLKRKIEEHQAAIIYVASPVNVLKVFLANRHLNNVIVTEHASFQGYNAIYQFIVKKLYKKVALLCVPTTDDSSFYTSIGIRNHYLPNPLSFYPAEQSTLKNKIVLNVARFTDDKQHDLLLKAWTQTTERANGWKLHLYGQGENELKIKTLIKELQLSDSVSVFTPIKNIEEKFIESSIFALSSRSEGFGLVLAEAMACGVPCISFNCPTGPKDIIDHERNGFLIAPDNTALFAKSLDRLMKDAPLRKKLGAKARIDSKKFDENVIGTKLCNLINSVFNSNK